MRIVRNLAFLVIVCFALVGRAHSVSAATDCDTYISGTDGCSGSDLTIWELSGQSFVECSNYCSSLPSCNNASTCYVRDEYCDWELGPSASWYCDCLCEY